MRKIGFFVFSFIIGFAPWVQSVAAVSDPIQKTLDDCLAKPGGETTMGMVECTNAATGAYNKKMNETYKRLMKELDPKSRDLLRTSQRQWLAFRDAEHAVWGAPWREDRGTIVQIEVASAEMTAVKERADELGFYEEDNLK